MNDDKVETVFPLPVYAVLIALALCWPSAVFAEPMMDFKVDAQTRIVLHNEPCTLKDQVTNLPGRATWEGSQVFEGCFGFDPRYQQIRMFFSDKTVVSAPVQEFNKLLSV